MYFVYRFKDFASEVRGNMDVEVLLGRQHARDRHRDRQHRRATETGIVQATQTGIVQATQTGIVQATETGIVQAT